MNTKMMMMVVTILMIIMLFHRDDGNDDDDDDKAYNMSWPTALSGGHRVVDGDDDFHKVGRR